LEELIHEAGISASDVDDSSLGPKTGVLNQPERHGRNRLKPAEVLTRFGLVDPLPVLSVVHGESSPDYVQKRLAHSSIGGLTSNWWAWCAPGVRVDGVLPCAFGLLPSPPSPPVRNPGVRCRRWRGAEAWPTAR
jgi:hypothetical protein